MVMVGSFSLNKSGFGSSDGRQSTVISCQPAMGQSESLQVGIPSMRRPRSV